MNFIFYDIVLLILFVIFVLIFLYKKKKNIKKEGVLVLYKTKLGIKLIDRIGKKYKKTLHYLSYVSIGLGYILMISMMYLILQSVYLYLTTPIAKIIKAPPVAPLIPYFPKIFGLESFLPPFYFIYFIISILIVATVHEFSHGIFAKKHGIRIKNTGFAFFKFFPAILGAFVEQDEKQMVKAKKFKQMSVLSAGVFANVITAILFYVILFLFFTLTFSPAGIVFNSYSYSAVDVSKISSVNGNLLDNSNYSQILEFSDDNELNNITADGINYVVTKANLLKQKNNSGIIILYHDAPAIKFKIGEIITKINGVEITSTEIIKEELQKYSPSDKITVESLIDGKPVEKEIVLEKNPNNPDNAWLGIVFFENQKTGTGKILSIIPPYKEEHVYYEASEASIFVKDLLWWIVLINFLVALFNMLPLGILDGGRFFYLTIWGATKSEKTAKKMFLYATYFLLLLLVVLMIKWLFNFL